MFTRYSKLGLFGLASCGIVFVAGCVPYETEYELVEKYKLYDDVALLVDRAVEKAATEAVTKLSLSNTETYAVVNIECPREVDAHPNSTVYDALVTAVTRSGAKIVERDDDVLVRLSQEALSALRVSPLTLNKGPGSAFSWDARHECRERGSDVLVEDTPVPAPDPAVQTVQEELEVRMLIREGVETTVTRKTTELIPTGMADLPVASKLLAYRINECGMRYGFDTGDVEYDRKHMKRRNALADLTVRVVDIKTGQIEGAATVRGKAHDYIPESHVRYLEGQLYAPYPFAYPAYRDRGREPRVATWRERVEAPPPPEIEEIVTEKPPLGFGVEAIPFGFTWADGQYDGAVRLVFSREEWPMAKKFLLGYRGFSSEVTIDEPPWVSDWSTTFDLHCIAVGGAAEWQIGRTQGIEFRLELLYPLVQTKKDSDDPDPDLGDVGDFWPMPISIGAGVGWNYKMLKNLAVGAVVDLYYTPLEVEAEVQIGGIWEDNSYAVTPGSISAYVAYTF